MKKKCSLSVWIAVLVLVFPSIAFSQMIFHVRGQYSRYEHQRLRPGTSHRYIIRLRYGQELTVKIKQKQNLRHGLLGIQLRYAGGYYTMYDCSGGSPFKKNQLIVTTDPCEYYKKNKTLRFVSYGKGRYVIMIFGIRRSGGVYDLDIEKE